MLRRGVRDLLDLRSPSPLTGEYAVSGPSGPGQSGLRQSGQMGQMTAEEVRQQLEEAKVRAERRQAVEERVREMLLRGCWRAFGGLVGDSQFAGLGVVLVGVLAEVGACVGLPKEKERMQEVMATSVRVTGVKRGEVVERVYGGGDEDLGVLVGREEETATTRQEGQDEVATESHGGGDQVKELDRVTEEGKAKGAGVGAESTATTLSSKATEAREKKKKRRKKGNAIDDIFAGF